MDVKDPSIPVRVPSQRPLLSFFSLFFFSQAYKPGQTLALPEFMRMFSFTLIKSVFTHTSHSCEMISCWMLMRHHMKVTAAQWLFVANRFTLWQKCCHNWTILRARRQSDLLCKLEDSSERQMMFGCFYVFLDACVCSPVCQCVHAGTSATIEGCACICECLHVFKRTGGFDPVVGDYWSSLVFSK